MKGINAKSGAKLNEFFNFTFWGFNFSAGYFFCKQNNNSFLMSI